MRLENVGDVPDRLVDAGVRRFGRLLRRPYSAFRTALAASLLWSLIGWRWDTLRAGTLSNIQESATVIPRAMLIPPSYLLTSVQSRAESAFQALRDFLKNDLKVYADKVIRSYNSFIPLFDFF